MEIVAVRFGILRNKNNCSVKTFVFRKPKFSDARKDLSKISFYEAETVIFGFLRQFHVILPLFRFVRPKLVKLFTVTNSYFKLRK